MAKKYKTSIRWKLVMLIFAMGSMLSAFGIALSHSWYKNSYLQQNSDDLNLISKFMAQKIIQDFTDLRNHIVFIASHNQSLRDAVARANATYEGVVEKEYQARFKELDDTWANTGWKRVEKDIIGSEASSVLKDIIDMSAMPLAEAFITDKKGALVASTGKTTDYYQADEGWWQAGMKEGHPILYLSEIAFDESSGVFSFTLVCPVTDGKGGVLGLMKVVIDKDKAFRKLFTTYLKAGDILGIISSDGQNLFLFNPLRTISAEEVRRSLVDLINQHKDTKSTRIVTPARGQAFLVSLSMIDKDFFQDPRDVYVYSLRNVSGASSLVNNVVLKITLVCVFFVLFACAFFFVFAGKYLTPLDQLKRLFPLIKKGIFDQKVHVSSGDELEELAAAFNEMVEELRGNMITVDYFNRVIQYVSDMLFVVNARGGFDLVNQRTCEVLGYTSEELKKKEAIEIFSKKDRYIVNWGLKGLVEEAALKDKRVNLLTKSGKEVDVYLGTRIIRDSTNSLVGLVCVAKDLTEVNRLVDQLKRTNEASLQQKEELEKLLSDLMESRNVMLSILEDTDESKKALEEMFTKLKHTQEELVQAEKMISLGQIAAGVAHEINNPLFVISGEAEMLGMEEGLLPGVKESVANIRQQVTRIEDIIKRLLEFSRKKETKFIDLEVNKAIDDSITLLKYQTKILSNIEIVKDLADRPFWVHGDQNQLQEVFLNIMINAVQAMEEKGGVLTIRTSFEIIKEPQESLGKFRAGDEVIRMDFSDTGAGMKPEIFKRIFDPFFTTKKTGIGLGLAVCFGIIESHKGHIYVDSKVGEGTTFSIKLPLLKKGKE